MTHFYHCFNSYWAWLWIVVIFYRFPDFCKKFLSFQNIFHFLLQFHFPHLLMDFTRFLQISIYWRNFLIKFSRYFIFLSLFQIILQLLMDCGYILQISWFLQELFEFPKYFPLFIVVSYYFPHLLTDFTSFLQFSTYCRNF